MTPGEVLTFEPDPRDSSPIYMQLARRLAQLIRESHYKPDEALPSERLLAETNDFKFNVGLVIIDFLIRHGYLTPERADYSQLALGLSRRP